MASKRPANLKQLEEGDSLIILSPFMMKNKYACLLNNFGGAGEEAPESSASVSLIYKTPGMHNT